MGSEQGEGNKRLPRPDLWGNPRCTFPVWMQRELGWGPACSEAAFQPLRWWQRLKPRPRGRDSLPSLGLPGACPGASLTGTSSKAMLVTLLWGQLCQALFRRKARALVCRPSRAANFRKVQF